MNKYCPSVEDCEAQLCPLEEPELAHRVWYPDEPICKARKFQSLPWVRIQKRIARLFHDADIGCFTIAMLGNVQRVTRGLHGANPDKQDYEKKWISQKLGGGDLSA